MGYEDSTISPEGNAIESEWMGAVTRLAKRAHELMKEGELKDDAIAMAMKEIDIKLNDEDKAKLGLQIGVKEPMSKSTKDLLIIYLENTL